MKTTIITFSSRKNGNCAQIAKLLQSITQESVLFDFSEFEIHACGGCNYECFKNREACVYIDDMECELLDAYLQVPKRSIVVSNTNEENFVRALAYQTEKEPDILFLSAKNYGKKSIAGDLLTDEKVVEDITKFVRQIS